MSEGGTVYGGGSYDGQMNINPLPEDDENRVIRAYTVPAFHPAPRDILMIGLGSGSWLEVLSNLDEVTSITVVEINGGYVEMMRRTPLVAPALTHPKVRILIDDGKRFLNRTTQSFDIIIQNTIVYWRAHASTLLSQEYLELSGRHLKPGGVIYLNSTQSTAAQKTVATVFPHAVRFQNMMIGGFSPIVIDRARWEDKLVTWRIGGRLMVDPLIHAAAVERIMGQTIWRGGPTWEGRESILRRTLDDPIITDDNMATEWWAWDTYP